MTLSQRRWSIGIYTVAAVALVWSGLYWMKALERGTPMRVVVLVFAASCVGAVIFGTLHAMAARVLGERTGTLIAVDVILAAIFAAVFVTQCG